MTQGRDNANLPSICVRLPQPRLTPIIFANEIRGGDSDLRDWSCRNHRGNIRRQNGAGPIRSQQRRTVLTLTKILRRRKDRRRCRHPWRQPRGLELRTRIHRRRAISSSPPKRRSVHGYQLHFDPAGGGQIVYWVDSREYIEWPQGCPRSGKFTIELTYSCAKEAGGRFQVSAGPYLLAGRARPTGDWKTYRTVTVGTITLEQEHTSILLQCEGELRNALMNVKQLRLIPVVQ